MALRGPVLRFVVVAILVLAHLLTMVLSEATTPQPQGTGLSVHYEASTMTSISVSWKDNSTEAGAATFYQIKALSLATDVLLVSPKFPANQTEYTLPDLAVNAEYEICIWSSVESVKPGCAVFSTIPVVRDDSLIALLIALAVLGVVIIIAVILWRCAIRQAGTGEDADTPSEEKPDNEDDDKHGANEKAPLLVPTTAETDQSSPPPADPASTQPDASNQEQPQSLYLFLAGHAYK